jgi:hypothetical protein
MKQLKNNEKKKLGKLAWLKSNQTKNSSTKMLILISIVLFLAAQTLAWLQINGQFVWPWAKDHTLLLSLVGVPISYLLMLASDYAYEGMDGKLWPGRFMAFAIGMLVFTILTSLLLGEGMTVKSGVSLFLALVIIILQLI